MVKIAEAPGFLHRWVCVAALCILSLPFQTTAQAQDHEIVFGLVPALSPEAMVRRFQPLAKHLSNEIGVPVRLEGAPDFATYMNRVLEGSRYDLIFTGGDFYRLAERRSDYRAIARVDGPGVQGIIVAAKDDDYNSFADLPQNVRVASVGELALMHRLGSQTLRKNDIVFGKNATLLETPSHNAAMLSVLSDKADIAIIAAPFFGRIEAGIRDRIVVLTPTALAPYHPLSASAQLSADVVDRLTAALLALHETPDGLAALEAMSFPGFVAAEPGLYDVMDWAADDIERLLGFESN